MGFKDSSIFSFLMIANLTLFLNKFMRSLLLYTCIFSTQLNKSQTPVAFVTPVIMLTHFSPFDIIKYQIETMIGLKTKVKNSMSLRQQCHNQESHNG